MAELENNHRRPQTLGTDCKECIFFQDTKECKLGIIEKFKAKGAFIEEIDGKFMIDRICNFRRTEDWLPFKVETIEECMERVKKEVEITGSIVIYADDLQSLRATIAKLSTIKHISTFKIIVAHHSNISVEDMFEFIVHQTSFKEIFAVRVNEGELHTGEIHFLDEAFKRAKNGFIVTIKSSEDFDENILDKLYHYIYVKMNRLLYVAPDEEKTCSVVHAFIYKFLKGNKFWDFTSKLEQVTEYQQLKSQILSWDEIDAEYND
jgi:hypothetical protein